MKNNVISIDLAKNVFQICLLNEHNKVIVNKKVKRSRVLDSILKLDAKRIVMEACYSSNYWGRVFQQQGYQVDLIPPHQVKPFVVGNKNDYNDAIAIAEASRRPKATFVAVKTLEQQDIQSLDRIRNRLIKARTALTNQLRGLLAEYGIVIEKKISAVREAIPCILENVDHQLTMTAREFIHDLYQELSGFDQRIQTIDLKSASLLSDNDHYRRLQTIPGIGPVVGRGIICSVNAPEQFANGRQMAAWIGITPQQYASGDQSRLGGISKRGNRQLRKQLIHGARAVVRWCEGKDDPLSLWLQKLLKTKHKNIVVVALANKMARIAWAVMSRGEEYNPELLASS